MVEWVKIQYLWWMLNKIYFQMKKTPKKMFILFNFHVNFEDETKKTHLQLMPLLSIQYQITTLPQIEVPVGIRIPITPQHTCFLYNTIKMGRSYGRHHKNWGPVSQEVWDYEVPPCSKAVSSRQRSKFCSPSPAMVRCIVQQQQKPTNIDKTIFLLFVLTLMMNIWWICQGKKCANKFSK